MRALYDQARHDSLAAIKWDAARARDAIAAICRDAERAFDPRRLWPLHPADDEPGTPPVLRGLYLGAAGMLHAFARLAEAGIDATPALDARAIVDGLHEAALAAPDEEDAGASLFVGSAGILLVAHRFAPSGAAADQLAEAIAGHIEHSANELLLGAPGTMLAARAMHGRTGEARFERLWRAAANTLLAREEPDGLWTQELYDRRVRALGAAHGFAGSARALLGAPEWLDGAAAVEARAVAVLERLAIRDGGGANWPAAANGGDSDGPPRLQWCHGAPGIVTSLRDALPDELLRAAGELVWHAGPLAANAGLCHGTAGNGFALLALFERTADELWLHRARAFAMHALAQVERFGARDGRGHYGLFTGDVGAALLAASCLGDGADARFPGIDDL